MMFWSCSEVKIQTEVVVLTPPAQFYSEATKPELEEPTNKGLLKYVLVLEQHIEKLHIDRLKIKEWGANIMGKGNNQK